MRYRKRTVAVGTRVKSQPINKRWIVDQFHALMSSWDFPCVPA